MIGLKAVISNDIRIRDIPTSLKNELEHMLTFPNPEYQKKSRMGFYTGNTPKNILLYEREGDELILPYGTMDHLSEGIYDFRDNEEVDYETDIPLRDYQQKALNELLIKGHGILQAPAGSGKTRTAVALITKWKCKTLWLCHTKDLVIQAKRAAEEFIDPSLTGTIMEGKVDISRGITFATIQTAANMDLIKHRYDWDLIIVDECHRVSGSPTMLTRYQKVLNNLSARHKYGLSATVHRADGLEKCIFALIGNVACVIPEEAVADNIMKVGILPVGTGTQISREALNTDGTLNYTKLINYLVKVPDRNGMILQELKNRRGHSCLILSDRVRHLEKMISMLPEDMKKDAALITGKMTSKKGKAQREQAIEDMRSGKKKYLFASYSLAKEGLDIPRLDSLFLTTPVKDYAVVTQSIGRIARVFPEKENPVCYDFVDDIGYCVRAYKKRCATYRKNACLFLD